MSLYDDKELLEEIDEKSGLPKWRMELLVEQGKIYRFLEEINEVCKKHNRMIYAIGGSYMVDEMNGRKYEPSAGKWIELT